MSLPRGHNDMEGRLSVMDQAGVAVQVLSVGALDIGLARTRASLVARRINDALSEICVKANGRFRFVAFVGAGRSRGVGQRNGSDGRYGRCGRRNHDHGRGKITGCG